MIIQLYTTASYSDTPRAFGVGGVGGAVGVHPEGLTFQPLKKASDDRKLGRATNIQSQQRYCFML